MLVSDAGLSAIKPQWWNASPLGCILIGLQPRDGWQIMQRAVQWGTDVPANCFRVTCNPNVLYAYFACRGLEIGSLRKSETDTLQAPVHLSSDEPRVATVALAASIQGRHSSEALELQISSQQHISEGTGRNAGSTAPRNTKSKRLRILLRLDQKKMGSAA